jgi:hypothetical protein
MNTLTVETANHLFEYKDGNLYWKNPVQKQNIGKVVGFDSGHGYKRVDIKGKQFSVHRIVFLMHHGYLPKMIDHIDGNGTNNAIENLRETDSSKNNFNSVYKNKNKSGYRNVFYNEERNNWTIYITINKKTKFFGSYEDVELAGLVAEEARRKYHGEFFTQRGIN